jgi:hypothetical protein
LKIFQLLENPFGSHDDEWALIRAVSDKPTGLLPQSTHNGAWNLHHEVLCKIPKKTKKRKTKEDEREQWERRTKERPRFLSDLCFNTIASSLYKCYFWKLSYLPSYQGLF